MLFLTRITKRCQCCQRGLRKLCSTWNGAQPCTASAPTHSCATVAALFMQCLLQGTVLKQPFCPPMGKMSTLFPRNLVVGAETMSYCQSWCSP